MEGQDELYDDSKGMPPAHRGLPSTEMHPEFTCYSHVSIELANLQNGEPRTYNIRTRGVGDRR